MSGTDPGLLTLREIVRKNAHEPSDSHRVLPLAFNGTSYEVLNVDGSGALIVSADVSVLTTQASIGPVGFLAFGSIGVGYSTLLADPGADYVQLIVFNTLDQPVTLSLDGGATDHFRLPVRGNMVLDFASNGRRILANNISVKRTSIAPTAGEISATAVR